VLGCVFLPCLLCTFLFCLLFFVPRWQTQRDKPALQQQFPGCLSPASPLLIFGGYIFTGKDFSGKSVDTCYGLLVERTVDFTSSQQPP
jgi:hypothetical protein